MIITPYKNNIYSSGRSNLGFTQTLCSYFFNGTNARVNYSDSFSSVIEGVNKVFSVRLVVKRNLVGNNDWIFNNWAGTGNQRSMAIVLGTNNKITVFFSSTGTASSGNWTSNDAVVADLLWHDLIVTYNAGTVIVYLDGVAIAGTSTTIPTTLFSSTADVTLGDGNGHAVFSKTYINQFTLTDDVVTSDEAVSLYNSGNPRISTDLINTTNQYVFDNDTWDGSKWTVIDDVGGINGITEGILAVDKDCNENPY